MRVIAAMRHRPDGKPNARVGECEVEYVARWANGGVGE